MSQTSIEMTSVGSQTYEIGTLGPGSKVRRTGTPGATTPTFTSTVGSQTSFNVVITGPSNSALVAIGIL